MSEAIDLDVEVQPEGEQLVEGGEESGQFEEGQYEGDQLESSVDQVEVSAETSTELKEEIADAIDDGATEEDVKDMIREFELKVNGKTVTKKIDLSDEESLIREFQIAEANKGGMQRAREIEKLYEQELTRMKERPWEVMKELGIDVEALNEDFIANRVEEMKKSPDQLAMEKMQKELTEAREREAKMIERHRIAEGEKLQSEAAAELNSQMDEVLSAHTSLPNSPKVRERVAEAMLWTIENSKELGIDPDKLHVRDVIPSVEQEIKREMQGFMQELPAELIETYIGKASMEKMRKNRLSSAKKAPASSTVKQTAKSVIKEEKKERNLISAKDFFRSL